MKHRLMFKFLIVFAAAAIGALVLILTAGSSFIYQKLLNDTSRRLNTEVMRIADDTAMKRIKDEASLNQMTTVLQTVAAYEDARILYLAQDGTVLLDTDDTKAGANRTVIEEFDAVRLGNSYYSTGNFFGYFPESQLSCMVPVSNELQISGYLSIHLPLSRLIASRESYLRMVLGLFGIILLLFLGVMLFILFSVQRPLSQIVAGAKEFSAGNLSHKIAVRSNDELGRLSSTLNFMAGELSRTGESQRNFISNVSHDFRSPLTSIKGYVEAILDGTIPPEMQEHYLGIVLHETKRLEKLTSGILTLNDINAKKTALELSDFDLNKTIKETAELFEGICTKRRIGIELVLAGSSLLVNADLGKIQQVLYNLVDNAIKFSKSNSSIKIETSIRHDKAYVSVRDHGIGIPADQLNKIWDRFYKVDSSRGKDTGGTGLGLAIVRDIIDTHEQTINVVSTAGAGSEFVFSLALAKKEG